MGYSRAQVNQWQAQAAHSAGKAVPAKRRRPVGTGDISAQKNWEASMARLPGAFLPIRLVSEANISSSVGAKWAQIRRKKEQRDHVKLGAARYVNPIRDRGLTPWVVKLTRYGKKPMDVADNLPRAFKAVTDEVSRMLDVDDGDQTAVKFTFEQVIIYKFYGIRIEIEENKNAGAALLGRGRQTDRRLYRRLNQQRRLVAGNGLLAQGGSLMSTKVGDKLYYFCIFDEGLWREAEITGQTTQSWLVKSGWREAKVKKNDFTSAPPAPGYTSRQQYYTEAEKMVKDAEWAWRKVNEHPVKEAVQRASFTVLQKVHALLVAEGVLKSEDGK